MSVNINVCLACDDNYACYAGVVIASVLANADTNDNLSFYILDGGISDKHIDELNSLKSIKPCNINFIKIDESMFEDYKKVKTHSYINLATYYRLKLPSLLPNVDRVIYFDCDIVVNASLKDLFMTQMGKNPIAGVLDIDKRKLRKNPKYVNAGMLVMDIKNMRELSLEQEFLEYTKKHIDTIKVGDQEILNEVLKDRITIVDDSWNVQSSNFTNRSNYMRNPKVVHFVSKKKPWHYGSFSYHRGLYFKYLQLTPWKLDKDELRHWTVDNQIYSLFKYFLYRPLFLLRPRFYKALYSTYLKRYAEFIFSFKNHGKTHKMITFMGLKLKFPKKEYLAKKKQSVYYYYKEKNIDITTLPPATGQIRDIQMANFALLLELDYVCKKAGLKYWLDGGTLLGAVRHKGFIPWDDDIDTAMLREDYTKIIEAFMQYSRDPNIFADYVRSKVNPCMCHIKVQHKLCSLLFVDIFPWDTYGKRLTETEQLEFSKYLRKLRSELEENANPAMSDFEIKHRIHNSMLKNVLTICDNKDPEGDYVWGLDFNHTWKNWFTHYEVLHPLKTIMFEGREFPCLNNPDAFLSRLYGNYMSYPEKISMGHSMFAELTQDEQDVINDLIKSLDKEESK